jgi:hypothetical protein
MADAVVRHGPVPVSAVMTSVSNHPFVTNIIVLVVIRARLFFLVPSLVM